MWEKIKGFFQSCLDFIAGILEAIINAILGFFEWIGGLIGDAIEWFFVEVIWTGVTKILDMINELPFDDMLAQINFGEIAVGSFATNFINLNLCIVTLITCVGFLATTALVKFLIKLIPSIG